MDNRDVTEFAEVMKGLSEVFDADGPPSAMKIEIYFRALQDLSIAEVKRAAAVIVKTRVYASFPKPANFADVLSDREEVDRPLLAWMKVEETVRGHGSYVDVQFDDPVIHSVIQSMGGWPKLGASTEDEWPWVQREFLKRYDLMKHKAGHPKMLKGIHSLKNGQQPGGVVRIGDTAKDVLKLMGAKGSGGETCLKSL